MLAQWSCRLGIPPSCARPVVEAGSFRHIWTSCRQLEYFHVRSHAIMEFVEDAIAGARTLKVAGRNGRLHSVDYQQGIPVVSDHWPQDMVMFRREELYGCPGWEWLTRHAPMYAN